MYTVPHPNQPEWFTPTPPVRYRPRKNFFVEVLKFLGLFTGFFVILVLIVMGPTVYAKLSYLWDKPGSFSEKYNLPVSVSSNSSEITDVASQFDQQTTKYTQDTIVIPKINVEAPIVYLKTFDNAKILEEIKNGVGHYQGTALPGRVGNVFLTGHSSYYWWSKGKYNQIFANLDKLATGDLIYIYYENEKFIYRVNQSYIVKPNQVEVLDPSNKPILTLMTCSPVGTNLRRLIIQSDLIGRPGILGGDFTDFTGIPKPPTILPLY